MSSTRGVHMPETVRLIDSSSSRSLTHLRELTPQAGEVSRLVFATEPLGLAVEQYRILRRRLCNLRPHGAVALVSSANPGEGKTVTSINLAWCLAEAGHSTCLLDLDFRAPGIAPGLGWSVDEDGVEDVLAGTRTLRQSLRRVQQTSLHVLGVKQRVTNLNTLLSSASLAPMFAELRSLFEWVIVDFAPVLPMADVGELLPQVDGVLLVIRPGRTPRTMIAPTLERLGSKVWGVILNDAEIQGSGYYTGYGSSESRSAR